MKIKYNAYIMQNQQDNFSCCFLALLLAVSLFINILSANSLVFPVEDQLIYISLRNNIIKHKEFIMPDIKVSEKDMSDKGKAFSETVGTADIKDDYFRATVKTGSKTAFWEPLFPIIISLLGALSRQIILIKLMNSLLYFFAMLFLIRLSKSYFHSRQSLLLVWTFIAFLPLNMIYNQKIMSETLFLFIISLAVFALESHEVKSSHLRTSLIIGLLASFAFLTKSQSIFILFPAVLFRYCRNRKRYLAVILVIICLFTAPWVIRNYYVFNSIVVFPTKGAITLWARNNPVFLYQDKKELNPLEDMALHHALKREYLYDFPDIKGYSEVSRQNEIKKHLAGIILKDPVNYLNMTLIRASILFKIPARGFLSPFLSLMLLSGAVCVSVINILKKRLVFINIILLSFYLTSVLLNSDTRFRIPFDPLIVLSAAVFIKDIYSASLRPVSEKELLNP